jgi:hypothetical protein
MEARPATEGERDDVLDELIAREPIFHRLELGTSRADFERLTAPDFWEVGASGRIYSREVVWETLEERYAHPADDPWETSDFRCRELAQGTYLLTYTLAQAERLTRRMTIWQDNPGGWQILYHQGTVIEQP